MDCNHDGDFNFQTHHHNNPYHFNQINGLQQTSLLGSNGTNAEKRLVGTDEQSAVTDGGGSHSMFADVVGGKNFRLCRSFPHGRLSGLIQDVNLSSAPTEAAEKGPLIRS